MTYEEAAAYIEKIPRFTKKHGLEHTKEFLSRLLNPAADRKIVHVAGTNGKGSVCAYLEAVLMAEGKKVGVFTSPHLVKINERIRMNHIPIDDEGFTRVFHEVLLAAVQMEEEGWGHPSYFEFLFGMGMKAFAETDVEYIILETGLGGRLDATNAVERPELAVITSISLDHTEILGDTIEQIAAEKAGIIKPGIPVFYDGSCEAASAVIQRIARENEAPCREISNHAYEIREVTRKYIAFSRVNAYDKDVIFQIPICGCYQAMNAELALCAAEYLLRGEEIREERWQAALSALKWEGRMERISPHLVIDGAHNPAAVKAFVKSVKVYAAEWERDSVILFSAVNDKNYKQMIEFLCENLNVRAYVVTELKGPRKVPARELERLFCQFTRKEVICEEKMEEALRKAEARRCGDGEVYCLGSLYLAGMIKEAVERGDISYA